MAVDLPVTDRPRLVIIGGGFAGMYLARALKGIPLQVVLLDKNNYHTFQPLLYQVATAGLEPAAIACAFRSIFQKQPNFHFRMAQVKKIDPERKVVETDVGEIEYDYLVIATGTRTNFYNMQDVAQHAVSMKSVAQAIALRNRILENFEKAQLTDDLQERERLMNIVIVGGGPTGIEVAGAIGELRRYIMPKDYPDLDVHRMQIHIVEMKDRLLTTMSKRASAQTERSLKKFDVNIWLNTRVISYDGQTIVLSNGKRLRSDIVIWVAGVEGNIIPGLTKAESVRGRRLKVDEYHKVLGYENIFALGDVAGVVSDKNPDGYPMLAPVAIQQAKNLARNLKIIVEKKKARWKPFRYYDKGVMATIGRNHAVVDLPFISYDGFPAWATWLFVHLMTLVGFRNKLIAFVNWAWNYFSYDRGVRLIIKPFYSLLNKSDE